MKKFLSLALIVVLTFSLYSCGLEEVSLLYTESGETDGFYIAVNRAAGCCFVAQYDCTKISEEYEITIPDEYKNIPIKRIGGSFGRGVPSPFRISLAQSYMNAPKESEYDMVYGSDIEDFNISDEYTVENVLFKLNIGKNIEVIEYVEMDEYYPGVNEDGSVTFYHPVVEIHCSEENKFFYSKDGKLYDKKTNALINEFEYAS